MWTEQTKDFAEISVGVSSSGTIVITLGPNAENGAKVTIGANHARFLVRELSAILERVDAAARAEGEP